MAPSLVDVPLIHRLLRLFDSVLREHRFTAHGLEHVPRTGPALLVVHHTRRSRAGRDNHTSGALGESARSSHASGRGVAASRSTGARPAP